MKFRIGRIVYLSLSKDGSTMGFAFRPVPGYARYRTPIEGLYLCGAAAHPGGGVMGTPGLNAAREILGRRRLRASV